MSSSTLSHPRDFEAANLEAELTRWVQAEANLLDERRWSDWEALWETDGIYWVPTRPGEYDPEARVSLIYDDRDSIASRVHRISKGLAYAWQPSSEAVRIVQTSDVAAVDGGLVEVQSRFVLVVSSHNRQETFAGRILHQFRKRPKGWGMTLKRVELIGADGRFGNLTTLL